MLHCNAYTKKANVCPKRLRVCHIDLGEALAALNSVINVYNFVRVSETNCLRHPSTSLVTTVSGSVEEL